MLPMPLVWTGSQAGISYYILDQGRGQTIAAQEADLSFTWKRVDQMAGKFGSIYPDLSLFAQHFAAEQLLLELAPDRVVMH